MPQPLRRAITTSRAPSPAFSYSQGVVFGDLLFIAGQVPRHPQTGEIPSDFDDQVRQTLDNVEAIAAEAGTSLAHALKVNVYLTDLATINAFDDVYRTYVSTPYPVRTTVQAGLRGCLVEIDAIVALATKGTP